MPDRDEQQMKEYIKLTVQYLKWNNPYRKYCQWMRKNKRQPQPSQPRIPNFLKLRSLYRLFGDIHSKSFNFEKWWEENREFFVSKNTVNDFKQIIRSKIERIIDKIRTLKKRDPSLGEFLEYFIDHLNSTPERALIEIDLGAGETVKGLCVKVKDLIEPMIENSRVQEYTRLLSFLYYRPPHPFRPDDLEQNLRIYTYRIKEKLSWREIAEKYIQEDYTENLKRRLQFQFNNAKRNVENIVIGYFPSHQEKIPLTAKKS